MVSAEAPPEGEGNTAEGGCFAINFILGLRIARIAGTAITKKDIGIHTTLHRSYISIF